MIDIGLTDEQQAVRDVARALAREVVAPAAAEAERTGTVPERVWAALLDSGLTIAAPEGRDGVGLPGCLTQLVAAEELGAGDAAIALASLWAGAAGLVVTACGNPAQLDGWYGAGHGGRSGRLALYEGFGRGPDELTTSVEATDGGARVVGAKVAVPLAAGGGPLVVVGSDEGHGLIATVVAPSATGVEEAAAPADGWLALGCCDLRSVRFDAVAEVLPDADGRLVDVVSRVRLLPAATAIGTARRAVEYAADYANERVAFGRPISGFQGVSFLLAEAAIRLSAARLELWDLAARLDAGPVGIVSDALVGRAVAYAADVAAEAARDALQVLGGHGFITDHPVERWYRSTAAISTLDCDPAASAFSPAL